MNHPVPSPKPCSDSQTLYLNALKKQTRSIRLIRISVFILFLSVWELCSGLKLIDPFIFSSPSRIILAFLELLKDGTLLYHTGLTLLETCLSFILVFFLSIIAAALLWWNQTLSAITEPCLVILNSLPKSALVPLLLVWFGTTMNMILITAVSVVIFGSILTIYTCFKETDPEKLMLIRTLRGSRRDAFRLVVLPGSIPVLFGIMRSNIGLSLVGVIIAEFIGAKAGLGYLIIYSGQVFKLDWLMMSIVLLCFISCLLYFLLGKLETCITGKI